MPFTLDPEIAAAMAPLMAAKENAPVLAAGDVDGRRAALDPMLAMVNAMNPAPPDVETKDYYTKTPDGHDLLMRFYTKNAATKPSPAVLYMHGGGLILGQVAHFDSALSRYVSGTGVPFLSVEFRYSPEHQMPVQVHDAYAALCYLRDHAAELNVDPTRLAIMGDSGGGGVCAALAIYARDQGFTPELKKQILIYSMLDDRNTAVDENLVPFMLWSYDDNVTGWAAALGKSPAQLVTKEHKEDASVSPHCVPARLKEGGFAGLAPMYIEVGELDIFRDENVDYGRRAQREGVSVELHVHPGAPHGFEAFAPGAGVSRRARADRWRVLGEL